MNRVLNAISKSTLRFFFAGKERYWHLPFIVIGGIKISRKKCRQHSHSKHRRKDYQFVLL